MTEGYAAVHTSEEIDLATLTKRCSVLVARLEELTLVTFVSFSQLQLVSKTRQIIAEKTATCRFFPCISFLFKCLP
jgi:hypothetical protein